jgi:hypothetical protein
MDHLRKRLRRLTPRQASPETENGAASPSKKGGHGDHWGCIVRAAEQDDLLAFLRQVVETVEQPELFQAAGVGIAAHSPGDRLCATVLLVNDRLVTAYPEGQGGPVWPITVKEIVPWANGIEGQISGSCYGASVSFFDTRFYANRRRYASGETYNFRMSAFAYTLRRSEELEVESEEVGAKVSFRGAHAYMPANMGNEEADIDDYWFHSPFEGEPQHVELARKQLQIFPVIMAIPEHFEMALNLYAAPHALAPDMAGVAQGDDLEGFVWLQGYMEE